MGKLFFNLEHMARVYSRHDLATLDSRCADIASDLWTLANMDLARGNGTIAKELTKISEYIEEIGKAAWAANHVKDGNVVCYVSDGTNYTYTVRDS